MIGCIIHTQTRAALAMILLCYVTARAIPIQCSNTNTITFRRLRVFYKISTNAMHLIDIFRIRSSIKLLCRSTYIKSIQKMKILEHLISISNCVPVCECTLSICTSYIAYVCVVMPCVFCTYVRLWIHVCTYVCVCVVCTS